MRRNGQLTQKMRLLRRVWIMASIASSRETADELGSSGRMGRALAAEKHLTPEDLANRVRVPLATVYQWNSRGGGPRFMRVGKHVRYKIADVEAWEETLYVNHDAD
ncbi:helix-turn-helix transcriptional regulator [Microbispora bryophytorum]|uniref:helix-turn-helix transcriptional regulator n=1 Tax=Microbispora bryophytorum TaxID=1460882 RepID=UPI0033E6F4F1